MNPTDYSGIQLPWRWTLPGKAPSIDCTLKMYIGGAQKRPDAPYARTVTNPSGKVVGQVSEGNGKDIREAVEAAHRAAPGLHSLGKRAAHHCAQIVYYSTENLELRHDEVTQRSSSMTGHDIEGVCLDIKLITGSQEDAELAVGAAQKTYETWSKLVDHVRARHMYSIARHVQKHARLGPADGDRDAGMGSNWSGGRHRTLELPPHAALMEDLSSSIAMGNTVILKPATYTRLTAHLFAEICAVAGLPPGVFNVVTGNGAFGQSLATHPDVDKVGFTGSTQVCSAGSRLIVEDTVAGRMVAKFRERMTHLRVGDSLDKY